MGIVRIGLLQNENEGVFVMKENFKTVNIKQGEEPRNQLELPTLHFIVTDQWTDLLSEKAIFAWLRMYSYGDRSNLVNDSSLWNQSRVPYSLSTIRKRLKVGNDTFYNKILKPLWNVGLIDFEEYENSTNEGQKPLNVIVYKYPQNDKSLSYAPLKEIRDYEKDYHSYARTFAKKGGRPKKKDSSITEQGGSEREHPPVLKENTPPFPNRTGGRSIIEHNNSLNSITNIFNSLTNNLNSITNNFNKDKGKKEEEENTLYKACSENPIYSALNDFLSEKNVDLEIRKNIIQELMNRGIEMFSIKNAMKQYKFMMDKLINEEVDSHNNFAVFFVNGLEMKAKQSALSKKHQLEELERFEAMKKENEERQMKNMDIYYNWLEEENVELSN